MREKQIVIRIPRLPERRWLALLGLAAVALSAAAYAWNPFTLTNPQNGDTLSASLFAANFDAVRAKVTELQNAIDKPVYRNAATGKLYSLSATFCGVTAPTNGAIVDGTLTGNVAAKSLCEKACASSPTAHMCTTNEVQRFLATGGVFPGGGNGGGWFSSGVWSWEGLGSKLLTDCNGWTNNTANIAATLSYARDSAHSDYCNALQPILCCD